MTIECWFRLQFGAIKQQHMMSTLLGVTELAQHWFMQWLVAWRHQAIAWTNID